MRSVASARHPWGLVLGAVVVGAYCWFSADLRPFTIPIDAAVAVPSLIVMAYAWRRSGVSVTKPAGNDVSGSRGSAPWVALFGVLVALELSAYFSSPRREHPTLSSISDALMGTHVGRAVMFALWLLLGWALLLRRAPA
jgi:hypothetical protein